MNKLFPSGDITFRNVTLDGAVLKQWPAKEINLKANVVCGTCNNDWMSDIEEQYAKPAMTDLILGKQVGALSRKRAMGLSLFAFKTAVIANCTLPEDHFFFAKSQRYAFRESLTIPPDVMMWLVGMEPIRGGGIGSHSVQYRSNVTLNVCSFWIGQLGFQVVSAKSTRPRKLESLPTPPGLTVCFYPTLEPGISWPRKNVLSVQAFNDFSNRWNMIKER
ncbi:MAG TPA: hypothetical protein VKA02_00185 [Candidatus Acidoferrum sp.]|nr:hypothetical protein [Candidatus Acidoferrum sp.]